MWKAIPMVAALLSCLSLVGDEKGKLESGCKKGEGVPAFQVKDVTGPSKGKQLCYT